MLSRLAMLICYSIIGACSTSDPVEIHDKELEDSAQVQVRLHVIGRLIGPDDTFGGAQSPKNLYIVSGSTNESIQRAITYVAKRDDGLHIQWIKNYDDVKVNELGEPPKKGAFLELKRMSNNGNRYTIKASITFSKWGEAGGGATYVYQKQKNEWQLIKKYDAWIS